MLADQLDYVVGVDPHRDSHALAVVHIVSGAVVFEATKPVRAPYARSLPFAPRAAESSPLCVSVGRADRV